MKTFRIENYETNNAQTASTPGFKIMAIGIYGAYFALAVIYFWFGGMKFTHYEAVGLVPLVSNSPSVHPETAPDNRVMKLTADYLPHPQTPLMHTTTKRPRTHRQTVDADLDAA